MSYLSIRNMHRAQEERERTLEARISEASGTDNHPPMYYWYFQKKTRTGKWKYVRDFIGSPAAAGSLFVNNFKPGKHRMIRVGSYEVIS